MELDILQEPRKTEVGSYFVSNYPPFSVWTPGQTADAVALLGERAANPTPLGLYIHIPFCRKRCKFCYFRVYTDKNSRDIDAYMQALADEIALYAGQERFAGRQFEFVYFGGGTPSYLSAQQIETLIERINRHWRWDAAREVTFECEPGTLQKHKLEAIRRIGVTRLSLGVEHFDPEVLEANGRAHRNEEIYRAYDWAREVGFPNINIDLIAGMVGETEDKWRATVAEALRLQPDCLTIYQMELPHNTVISKGMKESGAESPIADWPTKRRWVAYAWDQFMAAGYVVSSGYTLVKPSPHSRFVYRDSLWRGADMVGTGVASFSHVGGMHFQNLDRWEDYLAAVEGGRLPIHRAYRPTPEQLLIREFILQMKLGGVDAGYFRQKFGREIVHDFAEPLAELQRHGLLTVAGDRIEVTRAGLLRVDGLLPSFFEPEFRSVRYT